MKKRRAMPMVIALAVTGLVIWAGETEGFKNIFSPVYREFDAAILSKDNSKNEGDFKDRGSWNTKSKWGSRQLRGVLTVDSEANPCAEIIRRVDEFVAGHTGSFHTEGELAKQVRPEQKHAYGMWMYNCQGRHGELHLWLFPNRAEGEVAFAAYLYEEDLK